MLSFVYYQALHSDLLVLGEFMTLHVPEIYRQKIIVVIYGTSVMVHVFICHGRCCAA